MVDILDKMCPESGIIQLFCNCMATWYAMSQSHVKLMEIKTSCGHGLTVTQKQINNT